MSKEFTVDDKLAILDRAITITGCHESAAVLTGVPSDDKAEKVISTYKKLKELLNT